MISITIAILVRQGRLGFGNPQDFGALRFALFLVYETADMLKGPKPEIIKIGFNRSKIGSKK